MRGREDVVLLAESLVARLAPACAYPLSNAARVRRTQVDAER